MRAAVAPRISSGVLLNQDAAAIPAFMRPRIPDGRPITGAQRLPLGVMVVIWIRFRRTFPEVNRVPANRRDSAIRVVDSPVFDNHFSGGRGV